VNQEKAKTANGGVKTANGYGNEKRAD
jgi:hypothetical protein